MNTISNLSGYQILEQIYAGTRTLVYRAMRNSDQKPVVIKILRDEYPNFYDLVQFRNQYTISKNLNHPGLVQPLALEVHQNTYPLIIYALIMEDDGDICLVDYIKNQKKTSEKHKTLPLVDFLNIAIQLAEILQYLYQNRIIHKDIKPANILINPETHQIKLIDFSIASLLPRETQEIENAHGLEGTLAYISPEQTGRMNRAIDYRSDFYSLGVTFYELLTGKLPFTSDDMMELVHFHLARNPKPLDQVNPQIPSILAKIVHKLMAKNAENRYQSALGLKYDLEQCLTQLTETCSITEFPLGQRDICDRFLIPETLYGRETEVQKLLTTFERVSTGASEMMLVAGFSGIGKTAVINEVHKPIVRQRGYFIQGKYDQFNRHIPFSALVQAFQDLIGQLLSESDQQIEQWKIHILQAVGENGQLLIDVIPELEKIIGQQPPVVELSGTPAQNRFNLLLQKFLQVFTHPEHPLVLFLDDLQWIDSASLNLLPTLLDNSNYLLLLGAYRDNEVSPIHPLMLTLEKIVENQVNLTTITLAPLSEQNINQLVTDTLNCNPALAQPLSKLIYKKTQGNPFFATQFLKALHEDNLITFNWEINHWQCDLAQVEALAITNDVVEFMALQLQKLPLETQNSLKLAACIGAEFDLQTLAIVSQTSPQLAAINLWEALQTGLVIPTNKIYKFFTQLSPNEVVQASANPTYRFLHDRIQQASYSLIPDHEKPVTHLQIGQLLEQNLSDPEKQERLFDLVGHFNLARDLITDPQQREHLARLNLAAGQKARHSTAYSTARKFIDTGRQLLPENSWQKQYKLTLTLHIAAAEAAYLNGDFEGMKLEVNQVLEQAQNILDQVKIYEIQIKAMVAQSQMLEAIALGEQALAQLGVEFSAQAHETVIHNTLQTVASQLEGREIEELVNLPIMSDPLTIAAMEILAILFAPIFLANPALLPLLCGTMVKLSLQFGNAPISTIGYAMYGMVLSAFLGQVTQGYRFGRVALILLHDFNAREFKCLTLLLFGTFLQHRQEPLRAAILTLKEGYLAAMETGDFLYAGYNIFNSFYDSFFAGIRLDDWAADMENYCVVLTQVKQQSPLTYLRIQQQLVYNCQELVEQPDVLRGASYDETVMLAKHHQDNELTALAVVYVYKLILAYLFGNLNHAQQYINQAQQYLMAVGGTVYIPVFHFYAALTSLTLCYELPETEQAEQLKIALSHQAILAEWANYAPMNYQHKWDLVEAEKCRILGQKRAAIELYDQAIAGAKTNQYIQEEALAHELAAQFYLAWGKEKVAAGYMQDAYYCYARWGAKAKVLELERHYVQLLKPIVYKSDIADSLTETILGQTLTGTSTSSHISQVLDLTTLIRASQAVTSKIDLDQLRVSLLEIMLVNAGASKSILLLKEQEALQVVAKLEAGTDPQQLDPIPLALTQDLPTTVVYKVRRSLESVVLDDACRNSEFMADPYIQNHQPKSILCSPILHQGRLIGVLYLENNLSVGAFTSHRLELLKFLCSQAAVALENSRLYQESQQYAQQLEQSLEQLQISEARYRYLATATSQIIWLASPEGVNLDTVHWAAYTGQTPEEVQGTGWLNALHPDDLAHTIEVWQEAVRTKSLYKTEYRIRGADGIYRYFAVQGVPILAEDGNVKEWIGTCIDIDARRRAENELRRKSEELEQTLQELQAMQLQLVQNEKMSALGNLVAGIAHEINNPVGFLKGNIKPALEYVEDLFNLIDLYQAKYPEPDLDILEEIERIDFEFVREDLPQLVSSMGEGIKRIQEISHSLRTFSRADKDYPVACNIHDGINSTLMILKHRLKATQNHPEIKIIKDYGELPRIKCYAGQLNQVFMNILSNAVDAVEESNLGKAYGEIDNQIVIKTQVLPEQKQVQISITDNGVGMPPQIKAKVFEDLFTTKEVGKGTGLGLAIARQIVVEKHDGQIQVNSEQGVGTEFVITLPLL
ncbi:AAA family ATPase [Spirulina subsalsa FACHB-351]|uniref:histidine kinase n=1 Tax=Spirulina subsalsa FACHB-351 TaxID=234711 RepID=A0ABT3L6X9_9CYAN|nr:AAA family ATPase [Spirulina subsalsa]MCW6037267.1 AAA family ATPase [Spirulina subsalsa FACHB-351]